MDGSLLQRAIRYFLTVLVIAGAAFAPLVMAADRALIVGVGDYPGYDNDLAGIDLDVDMMQEVAARLGFKDVETLTDREATYDRFKSRFKQWLVDGTRSGDRVLMYFSGHGYCQADRDDDEADGKDEALVLYDGLLIDDEFRSLLQNLSGRHVLVLIDACHSGTGHKSFRLMENRSLGESVAYTKSLNCTARARTPGRSFEVVDDVGEPGVAFLAAAADHELALATKAGSLFTLGLHKAINDAASDQHSLTLRALRDEVDTFIRGKIASGDVRGEPHQPQFWGNPTFPIRLTVPTAGQGPIWRRLSGLADRASRTTELPISANQRRYQLGDELILTIDIPHAGYLNVVNVGSQDNATVLFPNQYHRDNYVSKQDGFRLPTPEMGFRLQAAEPAGPSLNVAFLTEKKIDLYEEGVGGRDRNGHFTALLAVLSARAKAIVTREIEERSFRPTASYGAAGGKVVVEVVR